MTIRTDHQSSWKYCYAKTVCKRVIGSCHVLIENLPVPSAAVARILGWSVHHHLVTVESLVLCILIGIAASLSTVCSAPAPVAVLRIESVGSILNRRVCSTKTTTLLIGLLSQVIEGWLRTGSDSLPAHRKNPTIGLCIVVSFKSGRIIVEKSEYLLVMKVGNSVLCRPFLRKSDLSRHSRIVPCDPTVQYWASDGFQCGLDICGRGSRRKIASNNDKGPRACALDRQAPSVIPDSRLPICRVERCQ